MPKQDTAKSLDHPAVFAAVRKAGGDESEEQGQPLDFPNFRIDGTDLFGGLHTDIERQCDVAAAGGGPDRVVQVRACRQLRDNRLDHPPFEVMNGLPYGLDPVNARERMRRFEKFHGWAMIDVWSHRKPRIGELGSMARSMPVPKTIKTVILIPIIPEPGRSGTNPRGAAFF